jgi:elongation factor Ts
MPKIEMVKKLRDMTGAPIGAIQKALDQAEGNEARALELLKQSGAASAEKRQGRATGQGRVEAYVHHDGRMGALVEVDCETDFVARTPDFIQFCKDVAMHVTAMNPRCVKADDLPAEERKNPADVKALCLLEQPFVKDQGQTVNELLKALIAKTGENVVIRRFTKFVVGEAA